MLSVIARTELRSQFNQKSQIIIAGNLIKNCASVKLLFPTFLKSIIRVELPVPDEENSKFIRESHCLLDKREL